MCINHHICSYGSAFPTCPAGFLLIVIPCGFTFLILALSDHYFCKANLSLPDSCEPTCRLPLHFQPFQVFHFESGFLIMLLLQATLIVHLVFQAPLSNLPNRFPHHFQPLRVFHFDFSFVEQIICKLLFFIARFLRTDLLTSSPFKSFKIFPFDSDDMYKSTFASFINLSSG